jgi:hypothetical protein
LWLGISGVGLIVTISLVLLLSGLPSRLLPSDQAWSLADLKALLTVQVCLTSLMLPLDLLGGLVLPNRWRANTITFAAFIKRWFGGIAVQTVMFLTAGIVILSMGRWLGLPGATLAVLFIAVVLVAFQLRIANLVAFTTLAENGKRGGDATVAEASRQTAEWGWKPLPIVVLDHVDSGFTGGVVGLPGMETIVLPAESLDHLVPSQLAVTLARRLEAVRSGSRTRGILFAFAWVVAGFILAAVVPGAGVTSVAELTMTGLGFTLWTFLGLLTLPTLSRQASFAIDRRVIAGGASSEVFYQTVKTLDRLQDDEPKRSSLVETIFHPVPSVENRATERSNGPPVAWHVARMTLFVSWACLGMLVRAVHCNVGRPELWVMLPTD